MPIEFLFPEWQFLPPQGQFNTRKPNVQNASKHTEIGQAFRRTVVAPPGRIFVEADYKSFHVVVLGWLAEDESYQRFGRLDPHSIYLSYLLHTNGVDKENVDWIDLKTWDDARILKQCKYVKDKYALERTKLAKPTVLGNQLNLGPDKLFQQNKKYIKSKKEAEGYQLILAEAFPKTHKWKKELPWKYYRTGRNYAIIKEVGRIQYFNDIVNRRWNKYLNTWEEVLGDGSRKLLAFWVQGVAFGHKTEALLQMAKDGWLEKFGFCNDVHDAIILMPKEEDQEECKKVMVQYMEAENVFPSLKVDVEVSVGKNWGKYNDDEKKGVVNLEGMREV